MKYDTHGITPSFYYEINKSKFLAFVFNVESVKEFQMLHQIIVNEHKKAKQICYAYKIIDNGIKYKVFNDTEPKGIAHSTIFSLIEKNNLSNIAVIVVRYFGGIKLGKNNLFRAYFYTANEALKDFLAIKSQ